MCLQHNRLNLFLRIPFAEGMTPEKVTSIDPPQIQNPDWDQGNIVELKFFILNKPFASEETIM